METKTTSMTDQIRVLTNKVHLAGKLVKIDRQSEEVNSDGVPYISIAGRVQCGKEMAKTVRFYSYIKAKKADGTDSKNYVKVKNWLATAVPEETAKPGQEVTMVDLVGSVVDAPYVNANHHLVEDVAFNIQFYNEFKEYAADIDLEGCIVGIADEKEGADSDNFTGRQLMSFVSRDIFGKCIHLQKCVVIKDLVDVLEDNDYVKGSTATFFFSLCPSKIAVPTSSKGKGFGIQRHTETVPSLEWVIVGAEPVVEPDSENYLDPRVISNFLNERKNMLETIEREGYKGASKSNTSSANASNRNSIGGTSTHVSSVEKVATKTEEVDVDDDELPF